MLTGYTIWAVSPSLNEQHRQFDLANMNPSQNAQEAQRDADAFAYIYNRDQKGNATDWVGVIKFEELGVETIPGYLSHKGA